MDCDICGSLRSTYQAAVAGLHVANQHLREARYGTLAGALSRREVHEALRSLIAADAEMKAHKAWHIQAITSLPSAEAAASL